MTPEKQYFHFTLGPVQSFVGQARRTRDLWAGSFLLSWLVAVAIKATQKQNGEIQFPLPDEDFLAYLEGGKRNSEPPRFGNIPNRFKAEVPAHFQPTQVVDSVKLAWQGLADLVWKHDLDKLVGKDSPTYALWQQQVGNFWEINWVLTPDSKESNGLDRRKNLRSHFPPEQTGFPCAIMGGWQELSTAEGLAQRATQREFWKNVCKDMRPKYDFSEKNEYLCAMAFIKRRFVHHFHKLNVPMPNSWQLTGWKLEPHVPALSYIAAIHWLEQVVLMASADPLAAFVEAAQVLEEEVKNERETEIACLQDAKEKRLDHAEQQFKENYLTKRAELGEFSQKILPETSKAEYSVYRTQMENLLNSLLQMNGDLFLETALRNPLRFPNQDQTKPVISVLKRIQKQLQKNKAIDCKPNPFYAILLMDGDSLGSHMSDVEKQKEISTALKQFTCSVPDIVYQHNGFLIYAGGDDVLAWLPLEDALTCALAVRQCYRQAFADTQHSELSQCTISAAVQFIHVNTPLINILKQTHQLLDDVAKDGCGRDAIAVRVWKRGGEAIEWAMRWNEAIENHEMKITTLADSQKDQSIAEFSSGFLYKIRENFEWLSKDHQPKFFSEEEEIDLLAVDYLASGKRQGQPTLSLAKAKENIKELLSQCRQGHKQQRLEVDGALLIRFLATKGIERGTL